MGCQLLGKRQSVYDLPSPDDQLLLVSHLLRNIFCSAEAPKMVVLVNNQESWKLFSCVVTNLTEGWEEWQISGSGRLKELCGPWEVGTGTGQSYPAGSPLGTCCSSPSQLLLQKTQKRQCILFLALFLQQLLLGTNNAPKAYLLWVWKLRMEDIFRRLYNSIYLIYFLKFRKITKLLWIPIWCIEYGINQNISFFLVPILWVSSILLHYSLHCSRLEQCKE